MEFKDLELVFTDHSILCMPGEPSVRFFKNDFIDEVMMDWEAPIMKRHAEVVCKKPNSDVLEIGFGMGIFADFVQKLRPKSHTIVECHPQVLERMEEWVKGKDNVRIIEGEWYEVKDQFETYDGVFYDAHNDRAFLQMFELKDYVRSGGVFTHWNGERGQTNIPFEAEYEVIYIDPDECEYFKGNEYNLPIVNF